MGLTAWATGATSWKKNEGGARKPPTNYPEILKEGKGNWETHNQADFHRKERKIQSLKGKKNDSGAPLPRKKQVTRGGSPADRLCPRSLAI